MLPQEVIRRKRDGGELTDAEIGFFVHGITDGSIGADQIAAFAMAVFFQDMSIDERVSLTRHMMRSGATLSWNELDLGGPVVDKHSTGGVGDKVSLLLAPIAAACGLFVPMISGRGLGHTGGTLDKLDAIPGYNTAPDKMTFASAVKTAGCAIIGQTDDLAPADRRLYAIRDVTATVESLPLITASILSKKLAAGLDGLVMDVKTGSGAFASSMAQADALARSIVTVANGAGLATHALMTDMNQVLGKSAGNALEALETINCLNGTSRDDRLLEVTCALAVEMLLVGGLAQDSESARKQIDETLASGEAAEVFARMVHTLGGPADLVERPEYHLPAAPVVVPCTPADGILGALDTRAVGLAVVSLGGGRVRVEDSIDYAVGLSEVAGVGDEVGVNRPLAMIHARNQDDADKASQALLSAATVGERSAPVESLIRRRYTESTEIAS